MKSLAIVLCYRVAYLLHHAICLRPGKPLRHSRLIVVGAYRTGGAGKTPFCTWLTETLAAQDKRVAILCHEYAYDEAAMLRKHFHTNPRVEVFETRNRYRLAHELDQAKKFDFILCDDGFEDSRLAGAVTFVLLWERAPVKIQNLWPLGNSRSLAKDHPSDCIEIHCTGNDPDLRFIIDKITNRDEDALKTEVNVFCGIGDPERFCHDIRAQGITIASTTFLKDHDRNFAQRLLQEIAAHPEQAFVISEKDAERFRILHGTAPDLPQNIYIARQKMIPGERLVHLVQDVLLNSTVSE